MADDEVSDSSDPRNWLLPEREDDADDLSDAEVRFEDDQPMPAPPVPPPPPGDESTEAVRTVSDPDDVPLRFGPDDTGISSYVSLGCSRHPMLDPTEMVTDALHGPPVTVTGYVRLISDGKFEERESIHGGFRYFNNGTSVVVDTEDGHTLLLVTTRYLNTSRQQYYSVGVRPEDFRIIVAKGVVSPRPAYQPIAAEMLLVNTAGASSADLATFDYTRRRRPLYPFEPDATYP